MNSSNRDWISDLHHELRQLAALLLSRERPGHTLTPTALVHESWLRLAQQRQQPWTTPTEFFPVAAAIMRRVLIDHARRHNAQRRPPGRLRLPIDSASLEIAGHPDELDLVLSRLEEHDARLALIVNLRVFAGLTLQETAQHLGLEPHEIKRDWSFAKAWLRKELGPA